MVWKEITSSLARLEGENAGWWTHNTSQRSDQPRCFKSLCT